MRTFDSCSLCLQRAREGNRGLKQTRCIPGGYVHLHYTSLYTTVNTDSHDNHHHSASRGIKRKFSVFDQETVDKLAQEAEEAALRQIEAEQAEARRAKLPDFWLPSLTPEAAPGRLMDIKLQTLCHQSHPSHPMKSVHEASFPDASFSITIR